MQVLGDLIRLPAEAGSLPLPWWHRAPLGLQSATWCYLSIVPSPKRPCADLVVSVLDPYEWPETIALQCRRDDRPGVVSDAIAAVYDTNIALAESVTMESGTEHEVTLICETEGRPSVRTLRKRLREGGFDLDSTRSYPERDLAWTRRVEIQGGWIRSDDWRSRIKKLCSGNENFSSIDLSKAVVSADTGNRLLRFVFPYKGSRTIKVEHRDTPGALKQTCDVLFRHELNVLSLLLRRGGAKPDNAMMIVACEPRVGAKPKELYPRVKADFDELPPKFMAEVKVSSGLNAAATIAPREIDTVVSRIPKSLVPRVQDERKGLKRGHLPVFVSRRFVDDRRAQAIGRDIHAALVDNECQALEASPQDQVREHSLIFLEVAAKMWVARAGIVLVTGVTDVDALGKNLPHEFGFLQGQTKPILLLVEGGSGDAVKAWSNIDGVYAPRFPENDEALDRASSVSVYQIVGDWTKRIKAE